MRGLRTQRRRTENFFERFFKFCGRVAKLLPGRRHVRKMPFDDHLVKRLLLLVRLDLALKLVFNREHVLVVVVVDIVVDIVFLDVFIVEKRFVVFIEKNRPRR